MPIVECVKCGAKHREGKPYKKLFFLCLNCVASEKSKEVIKKDEIDESW